MSTDRFLVLFILISLLAVSGCSSDGDSGSTDGDQDITDMDKPIDGDADIDPTEGDLPDGELTDVTDGDMDDDTNDGDVEEESEETDSDTDGDLIDGDVDNDSNDSEMETINGTWHDETSGLIWQNPPAGNLMEWDDAEEYCSNLNLDGHSDWRLPTISELRSLIRGCPGTVTGGACGVTDSCTYSSCQDGNCYDCAYDEGPVNGCYWPAKMKGSCNWYWSSSNVRDIDDGAWGVRFSGGRVGYYRIRSDNLGRCVRSSSRQ